MENKKNSFLLKVTKQIKSKEAKKYVSDELGYHLQQAKKAEMGKGMTEEEAETRAIDQMGNPMKLGQKLNKLHRPKVDWLMVLLLVAVLCISFMPIYALGYSDIDGLLIKKTVFVLIGGVAVFGLMMIDYRRFRNLGWLFFIIGTTILLLLILFPSSSINGAPVITIGPGTIDSLISIPFFFLAWASFFTNSRFKLWHFLLLFAFSVYLFLLIPSLSTTYIYIIMVFVMIWWSQFSRKILLSLSAISVGTIFIFGLTFWKYVEIYRLERLLAFLNPDKFANGAGFQYNLNKDLISGAGWFGNTAERPFLPGSFTDFVFVHFTYSYGWLLALLLVVILSLFILRIVNVIFKVKDPYAKLLLVGAVTLYGIQLVTNIGMALGFFPLISVSLPFISYGLLPTLLSSILIGIVLSIYRRKDIISSRCF